jgi:2-dehydropantoate 2-reductase
LCNGALALRDELQELLSQEQLADRIRIILATTTHGAYRERVNVNDNDTSNANVNETSNGKEIDKDDNGLFHVIHAGVGHTIIDDSDMSMPKLSGLLDRAGLFCSSSSGAAMQTVLWRKLAANSVINPVTALRRIPNGKLLEQSDWKHLLQSITEEVAAVAAADTMSSLVALEEQNQDAASPKDKRELQQLQEHLQADELTAAALQTYVEKVVTDTAANKSSMLQDVLAQRQTEIDYLSGYVVRRGRSLGVECPANEELWKQVRSLTASYEN